MLRIRYFEWGLLIDVALLLSSSIFFFSFLQFKDMTPTNSLQRTAVAFAILVLIGLAALLAKGLVVIFMNKYTLYFEEAYHNKKQFTLAEQDAHANYKYRNLWCFMNMDVQHSFYVTVYIVLRKIVAALNMVLLHNFQLMQMVIQCGMFLLFFLFYWMKKPFKRRRENYRIILSELFSAIGCGAIFLLSDDHSENEQLRVNIGWGIIICFLVVLVINDVIMLLEFVIEKCYGRKQKKLQIHSQREILGELKNNRMIDQLNGNKLKGSPSLNSREEQQTEDNFDLYGRATAAKNRMQVVPVLMEPKTSGFVNPKVRLNKFQRENIQNKKPQPNGDDMRFKNESTPHTPAGNTRQQSIMSQSNVQEQDQRLLDERQKSADSRRNNRYITLAVNPATGEKMIYQQKH